MLHISGRDQIARDRTWTNHVGSGHVAVRLAYPCKMMFLTSDEGSAIRDLFVPDVCGMTKARNRSPRLQTPVRRGTSWQFFVTPILHVTDGVAARLRGPGGISRTFLQRLPVLFPNPSATYYFEISPHS